MYPLSPTSILALGFLLGLKHATDADHVVAVTTIVSRERKLLHAALVGVSWGIGHTFMIIVVGIAIIIFHVSIPERTQLAFEFVVAVALVILGLLNLTGIMQKLLAKFSDIQRHHDHEPHPKKIAEFIEHFGVFHLIRPLVVGLLHGLAGSAAVALLVLGSITPGEIAIIYLGIFGVGTIAGMMLITTLLGVPLIAGARKFAQFDRFAAMLAGVISVIYGIYFGYQKGVVGGLFTF